MRDTHESKWIGSGETEEMTISRLKKRDNGKARIQQNKWKKWWFIGREFSNTEFEALAHVNLTAQRIIHNDTGRHIRGRDTIWGDGYRTLYSELEKDSSLNSNAFFSLTPAVTQSGQGPCLFTLWSKETKEMRLTGAREGQPWPRPHTGSILFRGRKSQ